MKKSSASSTTASQARARSARISSSRTFSNGRILACSSASPMMVFAAERAQDPGTARRDQANRRAARTHAYLYLAVTAMKPRPENLRLTCSAVFLSSEGRGSDTGIAAVSGVLLRLLAWCWHCWSVVMISYRASSRTPLVVSTRKSRDGRRRKAGCFRIYGLQVPVLAAVAAGPAPLAVREGGFNGAESRLRCLARGEDTTNS